MKGLILSGKNWAKFILLGLLWGSAFLWIKIAVREVHPILLVAMRLGFGVITLLMAVVFTRPEWPKTFKQWLPLLIFGITNTAIPYVLISWGERYVDSAIASVLNSTTPLFTMLMANLFLRDDRLTPGRAAGMVVGFVGVLVLLSRSLAAGSQASLIGQGGILLAAIFYAANAVYARKYTGGSSPVIQALVPLISADAALWLAALTTLHPISLPQMPLTWLALLWLGVFSTGIAFVLYFSLLHEVGPTRTTLTNYLFPLVGVLSGVIFLNETLSWNLVAGGLMIISGIVITNLKFPKRLNARIS
jgi:drug/metabolite transporter (DMT)-like permease